jgi:hypothetical protein
MLAIVTAFAFSACGGSSSNNSPSTDAGGTNDGGAGDDGAAGDDASDASPPMDYGSVSTMYPAFKPEMPQLVKGGTAVMHDPVIVTVTWDSDPDAPKYEAFSDALAPSAYFKTAVGEYGINGATAKHVRFHTAAQSFDQNSIADFVTQGSAGNLSGSTPWPAPTDQTIYIVFVDPSKQITRDINGTSTNLCDLGVGGYHSYAPQAGTAYAVVPRCGSGAVINKTLDETTSSAAHEIGEASVDAVPGQGYYSFDQAHAAWLLFNFFQVENGDLCEIYGTAFYKEAAPLSFGVQRMWSNASAAGGKAPCIPAPAGTYVNATPLNLEDVSADLSPGGSGYGVVHTKGYHIAPGTTKTFPIGFYSEAATTPFKVYATEALYPTSSNVVVPPPTYNLDISVDHSTGQNGEKAYVTVTVKKAGQMLLDRSANLVNYPKLNFITLLSSYAGNTSYMPILIVTTP